VKLLVAERDLGLGDFLTGLPALRALARAFPEHRRVLVASRAFKPLLDLADTGFALAEEIPLGADVAVNLHGKGPESTDRLRATRPRRLIAFDGTWRADEHEVQRWCRLLAEHGIPADPAQLDLRLGLPRTGATVIHPGAGSAARRWPAERWAAVARALPGPIVVTAGPGEDALARSIAPAVVQSDLSGLAVTIAGARLVLCGDTGVAHLATAFGTPSVVLFGPTPPSEWGPPPERTQHRALWAGRRGDPHATTPDPGLLEIQVEDVLAQVRAIRAARASAPRAPGSAVARARSTRIR
jgi:ADP-heptose:LPS heptosyltransferase